MRLAVALMVLGFAGCARVREAEVPRLLETNENYELARNTAEHPKDAKAWEDLGWHALLANGDTPRAIEAFHQSMLFEAGRPRSLFGLFLIAEDQGDLATTLDLAAQLLELKPGFPLEELVHARLARLPELGLPASAVTALEKLQAMRRPPAPGILLPEAVWTPYVQAILEGRRLEGLRECHRLAPRFAHVLGELGEAENGLNPKAQALQAALSLNRGHLRARVGLADLLMGRNLVEEADAQLQVASKLHPRSAYVLAARARLAVAAGQPGVAVRLSEEALAEAPGFQAALETQLIAGQEFRTHAAHESLMQQVRTAESSTATDLEKLLEQRQAALQTGDTAQAMALLEQAAAVAPQDARIAGSLLLSRQAVPRQSPQELQHWLEEAKQLRTDGFGSVVLLNQKTLEIQPDGTLHTRIHILAQVLLRGPEQEHWSFDYSPEEQTVRVTRAERRSPEGELLGIGQSQDQPSPLLQETNARIYNSHRRMAIDFGEVQPGDLLDLEYETHGRGTTAGQFLGDIQTLGTGAPTVHGMYEIRTPPGFPLVVQPGGRETPRYTRQETPTGVVHRLEADRIPGIRTEPMGPSGIERLPYAVVSTLQSWDGLIDWYLDLSGLRTLPPVDPSVAAFARDVCQNNPETAAVFLQDAVQQQIRYLGFELGQYDFKPHAPAEVLQARYGDCKDQSRLLVDLLATCGVPAEMVMIRTRSAGRIDMTAPYPGLFNHAIVYVPSLDAYADPTAPHHRLGELPADLLDVPALRVHPGAQLGRTPATTADDHTLKVEMRLRLTQEANGELVAQGRRGSTRTGLLCTPLRGALEQAPGSIENLELGGRIPQVGDRKVEDRPGQMTMNYRIRFALADNELAANLSPLGLTAMLELQTDRTQALRVRYPMSFRSRVELDTTALDRKPQALPAGSMEIPGGHYRFKAEFEQENLLVLTEDLRLERLEVATSQIPELKKLAELVDRTQRTKLKFP